MRITLAFVVGAVIGCAGGSAEGPSAPTAGGAANATAKSAGPGDVSFDVTPQEIKGIIFEPEALGRPGMPLVDAKKATTIEKQRQVVASTKDPVQKEAQAAVLATMLYRKSKDAKGDELQALLTDARQALRDAAQVSGDKVDEITLRLLGSYELLLEDYVAAEAAWGALVAKATPKDKDEPTNRAWWAYSLLKNHKNQEALAAVKDLTPSEKLPELAYVTAWAKWRTGDNAGAWQAILVAAKGWKDLPGREAINRDLLLFAGRTGASMADAVAQLSAVFGKSKDQQYELFAKLGLQSYGFAGRWNDGVAALEKAIEIGGDKVPANDRPVLRYQQADYTVRLDDPVTAEKYAKQALEALPVCGAKCSDKDKETVVESINVMAKLFHVLYATANDPRYYQPAHDLYNATNPLITMNDAQRTDSMKNAGILEQTLKGMKAGSGKHDPAAIGALLLRHNQEVQACYELGLAANPKLAGNLVVNVESDDGGAINGVSTDPKSGLADMSLVAGCVTDHVKTWRIPKRDRPGKTRIKMTYRMSPRKDAKDAK
jgi:hypothetical protein